MEQLPLEKIYEIALRMDLPEIAAFCRTAKYYNEVICESDYFWQKKLQQDYPDITTTEGYKETYQRIHSDYVPGSPTDAGHLKSRGEIMERYYLPPNIFQRELERLKYEGRRILELPIQTREQRRDATELRHIFIMKLRQLRKNYVGNDRYNKKHNKRKLCASNINMRDKLNGLNELYRRIYLLHLKRPEILQERYGMTPQELEDAKTDFFNGLRNLYNDYVDYCSIYQN